MANIVFLNAYQINQTVQSTPIKVGFATANVGLAFDVSGSPTRLLSTGVSVYSMIKSSVDGKEYYLIETTAQLATALG